MELEQSKTEKIMLFHIESMRQNIAEIRSWIFQLIILSGGIIGFTLPIFNTNPLVKNSCFLIIGLILLWIEIVLGIGYLKIKLEKENNNLNKQCDDMKNGKIQSSKNNLSLSFLGKHILNILYGIFIMATLMIIISMI